LMQIYKSVNIYLVLPTLKAWDKAHFESNTYLEADDRSNDTNFEV